MPRPPPKLVALAFGALVATHVALAAAGFHEVWFQPSTWTQNVGLLGLACGIFLIGRLLLSFLPPGPTGAHDGRGLAETWSTSLALGWLALVLVYPLLTRLGLTSSGEGAPPPGWLRALPLVVLAALAAARWLTLPGAMVPRHDVEREGFGRLRTPLVAALLGWLGYAVCTSAFLPALTWLALGIALERALARARRAAGGRALFLVAFVVLGSPGRSRGDVVGLRDEIGLAAALGFGAAYLVPWLRRADRRAAVLSALFFGGAFLRGWQPIALVGPLVLVLASRARQRAFAGLTVALAALACVAAGMWARGAWPQRGRMLLARELAREALDFKAWGLAWPLLALALAYGALTFPWRSTWQPGVIEEPRREALALGALLVLAALALAWPAARFGESECLLVLFPPAALLAGLLAIPAGGGEFARER